MVSSMDADGMRELAMMNEFKNSAMAAAATMIWIHSRISFFISIFLLDASLLS